LRLQRYVFFDIHQNLSTKKPPIAGDFLPSLTSMFHHRRRNRPFRSFKISFRRFFRYGQLIDQSLVVTEFIYNEQNITNIHHDTSCNFRAII